MEANCEIGFEMGNKILKAQTKEAYKEAQDILGKHLCSCEKLDCKISFQARLGERIQDKEGNYLGDYDPKDDEEEESF